MATVSTVTNPTPVRALVAAHLKASDAALDDLPTVSMQVELWRQIAVQAALESLLEEAGGVTTLGVPFGSRPPALAAMLLMTGVDLGPIEYVDRPSGPDQTMPCIETGLLLTDWDGAAIVLWIRSGFDPLTHTRSLTVEGKAASVDAVGSFLAALRARIAATSPFRGKSLRLILDRAGGITDIAFEPKPTITREQIILPDEVFAAVETHAVGVGLAAERLRAAGQHLKRGLLLHGPPGTGKTHTIRYLTTRLPDATLFVLTGGAMGQVKQITALLEELAPAVVVLDDIDLVAQDRAEADNSGSVLFNLLDAMDGLREDVDLLFVCTSNRAEVLEKAIAARPGRIDQAVEVGLPDATCRRRLLDLYGAGLDLRLSDVDAVLDRTDGVTASFVKELLRRACILAIAAGAGDTGSSGAPLVTDAHVHRALDILLDPDRPLTPALLGIHGPAGADRLERAKHRGVGQAWCGV